MNNTDLTETEILETNLTVEDQFQALLNFCIFSKSYYPYGIPKEDIVSSFMHDNSQQDNDKPIQSNSLNITTWGNESAKLAILVHFKAQIIEPWCGQEPELLKNIIIKGLNLKIEDVIVIIVPDLTNVNQSLVFDTANSKPLIIFGTELAHRFLTHTSNFERGKVFKNNEQSVIATHNLADMLKLSLFKKEAWNDLKEFLKEIKA
jgi:hypothetical protein